MSSSHGRSSPLKTTDPHETAQQVHLIVLCDFQDIYAAIFGIISSLFYIRKYCISREKHEIVLNSVGSGHDSSKTCRRVFYIPQPHHLDALTRWNVQHHLLQTWKLEWSLSYHRLWASFHPVSFSPRGIQHPFSKSSVTGRAGSGLETAAGCGRSPRPKRRGWVKNLSFVRQSKGRLHRLCLNIMFHDATTKSESVRNLKARWLPALWWRRCLFNTLQKCSHQTNPWPPCGRCRGDLSLSIMISEFLTLEIPLTYVWPQWQDSC